MPADAALPRIDAISALSAPASTSRQPRVGRTDYSERLTRQIARGEERPKPSAPPTPPSRSAPDAPSRATSTSETRGSARRPNERAAEVSSSSPHDSADSQGAATEAPSSAEAAAARTSEIADAAERIAAEAAELDQIEFEAMKIGATGGETAPVVIRFDDAVPPPPWSVADAASAEDLVPPRSIERGAIEVPAAIARLFADQDSEAMKAVAPATEGSAQGDAATPAGFAFGVLATEPDAVPVPVLPSTSAAPDPNAAPSVPTDQLKPDVTAVLETSPATTATSGEQNSQAAELAGGSEESAGVPSSAEATLSIAAETPDAMLPDAAVESSASQEQAAPIEDAAVIEPGETPERSAPDSASDTTAVSAGPTPRPEGSQPIPASSDDQRVADAASRITATTDSQPAATAETPAAAPGTEAVADADASVADDPEPAPAMSALRSAESGRPHRASATTAEAGIAAGDDLAGHAASALRAADGLDRPIKIRLTPPELGALRVEVSRQDGKVSARFEVATAAAQSALNDQMSSLRESLGRAGLTVDRIEVRLAETPREDGRSDERPDGQDQGREHRDDGGRRREERRPEAVWNDREDREVDVAGASAASGTDRVAAAPSRIPNTDAIDIQV